MSGFIVDLRIDAFINGENSVRIAVLSVKIGINIPHFMPSINGLSQSRTRVE
jgi:hypothetical protein